MIYTLIFKGNIEMWDCRDLRQPPVLLPNEIKEYIFSSKNEAVRAERLCAYSLLTLGLEAFFGVKDFKIARNKDGKPTLTDYASKTPIYISLSHSDGVACAALSDEGEIGIDLQAQIDEATEKRLSKRFFTNTKITPERLEVRYFLVDESLEIKEITLKDVDWKLSFTDRWAACESIIKCDGRGFEIASSVFEKIQDFTTELKLINTEKTEFSIAISKKKAL